MTCKVQDVFMTEVFLKSQDGIKRSKNRCIYWDKTSRLCSIGYYKGKPCGDISHCDYYEEVSEKEASKRLCNNDYKVKPVEQIVEVKDFKPPRKFKVERKECLYILSKLTIGPKVFLRCKYKECFLVIGKREGNEFSKVYEQKFDFYQGIEKTFGVTMPMSDNQVFWHARNYVMNELKLGQTKFSELTALCASNPKILYLH